ncbi:MAG: hypothetical protein ACKN81_07990, partial [Pirellulaceae bacterium]
PHRFVVPPQRHYPWEGDWVLWLPEAREIALPKLERVRGHHRIESENEWWSFANVPTQAYIAICDFMIQVIRSR